ncbi:hypothetical protein LWI29_035565 [Acer saccharum]|uniref:DUF4283 domain-containing protein n=1 Tax=Acer saccharum TaxID=4024 RepID=A0AA39SFZ4_ACESA|nr:hypothetical protein LWI29_035565 [Acer saccharum]
MDLATWARLLHLEQQHGLGCLGTSLPVSLILKLCYFYYFLCCWFVCVSGFLSMVSPSMLGLVEDPIVLDATLCSSSHTSVPICGGGSVSNSGGFRLGNVLPTASALCDILVSVGGPIQGPILNSNPVSIGSKSYADLLKSPQEFIQPFPMSATPLKKGGYVSFQVDPVAYQSRLDLCKNALIERVFLSSGERPWKLAELKAKLSTLWMISADWRLISLGRGYFQIILKSLEVKNQIWGLSSVNLKPRVLHLQPWIPDFNPSLQKSTDAQVWVRFYDLS